MLAQALDHPHDAAAVYYRSRPFLLACGLPPAEALAASPDLIPTARTTTENFVSALGRTPVWIEDTPGLVLPRIVCALANEAVFAVGEGVADPGTIDQAMRLGTNYPIGPLAWAAEIGYAHAIAVLDHLHAEYGEECYRVAPLLRKWARQERGKRIIEPFKGPMSLTNG